MDSIYRHTVGATSSANASASASQTPGRTANSHHHHHHHHNHHPHHHHHHHHQRHQRQHNLTIRVDHRDPADVNLPVSLSHTPPLPPPPSSATSLPNRSVSSPSLLTLQHPTQIRRPRTGSSGHSNSNNTKSRNFSDGAMDGTATMTTTTTTMKNRRGTAGSVSSASSSDLSNPFELRYGRRYLKDMPYPLPCDLSELHRQSLRTLLGVTVFSKPACAPDVAKTVPKKVLEIGCGSAYWSSTCHEWFVSLGHPNVEFAGMDVAPLAPDLGKQGVNWRFVQHDIRQLPWPFADGEFDFIMMKDMSLAIAMGVPTQTFVDEVIRILAPKGSLEIWESDHVLRCLLPAPPRPRGMTAEEEDTARQTKTYPISPGTPFAPAQNKYISDSNTWIHAALDKLNLPSSPCARIAQLLFQEPDSLEGVAARRVAVPLGQLRWEKDSEGKTPRSGSLGNIFGTPPKGKPRQADSALTDDQAALRYTALLTVVQKIESLEPLLKDASGKNAEEWTRWWSNMMTSLLDQEEFSTGEVLEVGAWWATKCG